jgi:hypothetical protein
MVDRLAVRTDEVDRGERNAGTTRQGSHGLGETDPKRCMEAREDIDRTGAGQGVLEDKATQS